MESYLLLLLYANAKILSTWSCAVRWLKLTFKIYILLSTVVFGVMQIGFTTSVCWVSLNPIFPGTIWTNVAFEKLQLMNVNYAISLSSTKFTNDERSCSSHASFALECLIYVPPLLISFSIFFSVQDILIPSSSILWKFNG